MNFNVYLEDEIGKKLEAISKKENVSRNALIRQAVKLLIDSKKRSQWSEDILNWNGIKEEISFESYRNELIPPAEKELF
ncbi:MAG: ribbon-helix-helix domain-containing protein [Xenococcaceae cyanobacterium MO_234.B1]|nr:ribbon-helix-helix domain-containing protein [Xenococcaceae cyanobacterium MO_234.B1]